MAETAAQRERSTIRFPYGDLDDAVVVARAIHQDYGTTCTLDQLAASLGQSLSGAFRAKVATASTFGVIETGRGEITLTDLGQSIADPQTSAAAAVEAFLSVPLYQAVFEKFRGSRLPGDQGFEAELVRFGVSPKVASKARQALQRSAEQAGFFSHGRDRLVRPSTANLTRVVTDSVHVTDDETATTRDDEQLPAPKGAVRHPLIVGLWEELPDPKNGTFTPEQQEAWLDAARVNLKLLYGGVASKREQAAVETVGITDTLHVKQEGPR